jgi:chromosomal replication initiation ATPase DnaA
MSSEKEILSVSSLLKNIQKGIKVYGLKQLNDSLEALINSGDGRDKIIDKILLIVCDDFKISKNILLFSNERGEIQEARRIATCLLFFNANIPVRTISKKIFERDWTLFVSKAIKRHRNINESIKPDREYKERYEKLEKILNKK